VYNLLRGECLPHWSRLFASPEGDFYPCIPATYFADRRFKVGDVVQGVDQERVAEISNSFQEVRQTRCSVCWAAPLCGECFAMFSWEDPEANCHRRHSHYADCLRNATELVELRPELVKVFSTDRTVVDDVSGDELLTSPS
jgi:radical SAM protein with 4Fe4S-binding SPASM domain